MYTCNIECSFTFKSSLSVDDFQYIYTYTLVQVVYAAQSLCAHPHSNMAQRNMVLFREAWVENVQLLQDSVEALVSLIDFMSVDGV